MSGSDGREFSGKVAFITGAAHGQGRASALALAKLGAKIAAFDVAEALPYPGYSMGSADLDSLRRECEASNSECLIAKGDVRDANAIAPPLQLRWTAGEGSISYSTTPEFAPTVWLTN